MSMAGNPSAPDEGSDLEIEEVEVLNPLDLSVEDMYYEGNVNENYLHQEEHPERVRDRNVSIDEDDIPVQDMDHQDRAESRSDTDNLDMKDDEDDEDASIVIENPNDDIPSPNLVYSSGDEIPVSLPVPINGFQEAFNQNLLNHGASTSGHVQDISSRRRKVLQRHRVSAGSRSTGRGHQTQVFRKEFARDEHDHDYANSSSTEKNDDIEYNDSTEVTGGSRPAIKRSSNVIVDSSINKKSRQSESLVLAGADPNLAEAADPPEEQQHELQPPQQANIPTFEELRAEVARLKQELETAATESASVASKYENLVTKMQAKVECPVCFDVPKQAPVPVCPNGHVVCQGCKRDLCPTCRVRMGHGTSILAVTVIENIPHSCEFQIYGCQVSCSILALPSHQAICKFRAVKCPNFNCVERVPLTSLAEHTLRRCIHNGTFYNTPLSNSYNYIIPANQTDQFDNRRNSTWRPDGITYDEKNFFLKITRKGKKAMWYFYVQMAGSEEDTKKYTATIYVFKSSVGVDGKNSHRFIGDICPIDLVSTDRAAEAGYCCVLTDAQMKRVFTEGCSRDSDKKYGFSVEVRIETEGEDTEETSVIVEGGNEVAASGSSAEGGQDQEPTRRIRRCFRNQPPNLDPPSPLNLVRRPLGTGTRPIPSFVTPGTSGGSVGPFVVDDHYVPRSGLRERARNVPTQPDSDDSSYEEVEDLVPCPQCGREYEISGVVKHAQECQAGSREHR